jgi:PAS domain S-box-containing protein
MSRLEQQGVFQALPDPAFRLDRRGTILELNTAARAAFPAGVALKGRLIQDTPLGAIASQLPGAFECVLARRCAVTLEHASATTDAPVHHEVRLAPLGGDEILALVRDVTETRLAEKSLRESDAQFRVVTQNITDAFWIRSPDMREVRYVSPAFERIWGRPAAYLYANPHLWASFIVPEDREHVLRTFSGLTGDSRSLDVEYRIARPDGEIRWVRVRGFQVRDAQDGLVCHTGIVTDITERKLAQAELDASQKQLIDASRRAGMAEIATNVLHNVGNILNSVTVSAGLVRGALRTSRARGLKQAVEMMDGQADRLGDFLVSDEKGRMLSGYLRDISLALQQEQEEMIVELEQLGRGIDHIRDVVTMQQSYAGRAGVVTSVRIGDLVEDAVRINGQKLERDNVTVVRAVAALPKVRLDRARVLQVLVNLIGNASEALRASPPEARRITVRVEAGTGGRVRLSVQDEGEGISDVNLTRIFAHGFTTRKHGHGFGLHSCAQAAAEMNGTLAVHSDGPGRGATFTLELPLEAPEAAP